MVFVSQKFDDSFTFISIDRVFCDSSEFEIVEPQAPPPSPPPTRCALLALLTCHSHHTHQIKGLAVHSTLVLDGIDLVSYQSGA